MLVFDHHMTQMMGINDRVYCLEVGRVIAARTPNSVRYNPHVIVSDWTSTNGSIARRGTGVLEGAH